jgi:hypothetical protein
MTGKGEKPRVGAPEETPEGPAKTDEQIAKELLVLLHPDLVHSNEPMDELFAARKAAEEGDPSVLHSMYDRCVRADIDARLEAKIVELRGEVRKRGMREALEVRKSGTREAPYDWPANILTQLYHSLCQKQGIEPDETHLMELFNREGWTAESRTGELRGSRLDRSA